MYQYSILQATMPAFSQQIGTRNSGDAPNGASPIYKCYSIVGPQRNYGNIVYILLSCFVDSSKEKSTFF